ncbi:hypothetical protein CsSME_00035207 [Camellia sinensis var. sinensis]
MAISAAASTVGSLNSSHSTCLSSSSASSSSASKLSLLSSLHFLRPLRRIQIGNKGFSSRSLPRILPQVVEVKNQTFSSLDDLLANSDMVNSFFIGVLVHSLVSTPSIADKHRIEALPTFIVFKDGEPYDHFEGALIANQLIGCIESALQVKQ